jgi:cyanophycinase
MARLVRDRPSGPALARRCPHCWAYVGAPCNTGPADGLRPRCRAFFWRSTCRSALAGCLRRAGFGRWCRVDTGVRGDRSLLERSGTRDVVVLPTAAAYWHPDKAIETAASYFAGLGATVKACMVLRRADAEDREHAGAVRAARFLYLAGGSVLHLRSVLKSSPVWEALVEAWGAGAVLAGSSAGAMVLGDAMVDPRGGALTLGLGLLPQLAVLPHAGDWSEEKTHRTVRLASGGLRIAAIDERTALLRAPDGRWYKRGSGNVTIWLDGKQVGLEALEQPVP